MPGSLRAVRHCIFTGRVVEESGICSAGFLRKHPRCGERASPLRLLTAFASISPKGRALGSPRNVSSSSAKCVGELKASPGRGKLSPQVTDEGAPFAATCRYPSSGATRHLFPLLSLRDIFPQRGGNLSPRSEGFFTGSSCTFVFRVFAYNVYLFARAYVILRCCITLLSGKGIIIS